MATTTSTAEKLLHLLHDFDAAMLVTRSTDGNLRSRPMVLADVDIDGTLWFLTQRHSGKTEEIAADQHVNVSLQSKQKFVSISGVARLMDDPAKVAQLWDETWRTWFPKGQHDPQLVLLQVKSEAGEYWDNSGASGLKYLIKAGKAYLSGTRPDLEHDPDIHGRVGCE